jgi:hypothetical protein
VFKKKKSDPIVNDTNLDVVAFQSLDLIKNINLKDIGTILT